MNFEKKKYAKAKINAKNANGGKKSTEMEETSLMREKEREHTEMFGVKTKNEETSDKEFIEKTLASSRLLTNATTELKKAKNRNVLRDAGVTLMTSGIKFALYGQALFQSKEQTSELIQSAQVFAGVVSFMNKSKNTFSALDLDGMEREDYENNKSHIVGLSKEMVVNTRTAVMKSDLQKYGFEKIVKKYEAKLRKLVRTMEAFESERSDKMPLMGTEGAS